MHSTSNTSLLQRKIIHVDMDCFFAAIEVRENPSLRGKPVAVGGQPGTRSVISTCSYEAREFGVRSAMPVSQALRLCPDLILIKGHMALYKKVSESIRGIFFEYTDLVEPLSLDEAFLDVTGVSHCGGSATLMAEEIRQKIVDKERLTASAGIAPNKFLAKVGSDWNKPNGQCVIKPADISTFVKKLPVRRINGVGNVTGQKMQALKIETCGDLQRYGRDELVEYFGRFGNALYDYARGIDERPVKPSRIRKSLSIEDTFLHDIDSLEMCLLEVTRLFDGLLVRLARAQEQESLSIKAAFVKLRFSDFSITTVQQISSLPTKQEYFALCAEAFRRKPLPVRLLGLGVQFHNPDMPLQLSLF